VTHFIDTVLEPALWFLADWSLRWAALIAVLALGLVLLRPRRTATRSLICWIVLLAGLVLPALPRWGTGVALPGSTEDATRHAEGIPVPIVEGPVAPREVHEQPAEVIPAAELPLLAEQPETPPPEELLGTRRVVLLGLAAFWLMGVCILAVRWLGGRLFLDRMRRAAQPLGGASFELFQACHAELGLQRGVALAAHPHVRSPIALGLLRPTVLVPPTWPELTVSVQRSTLLHELAHLARYDDWSALLLELVRVVFFFHPLLHWLLNRVEFERELLCDEAVLARGIDAHDYARILLEFSRQSGRLLPGAFGGPAYPLGIGHRHTVKIRIHQLLEENMIHWRSPLPIGRAIALGTVILGLAVVLGSIRVRAVTPEVTPDDPVATEPRAAEQEKRTATPAQKKESLRYGGKSFDQWRVELATELKPELRIDGIKALSTFGANGYDEEAARAILEVVRGYDLANRDADDSNVISAASRAMVKIGMPATWVLLETLKSERTSDRRFAVESLREMKSSAKGAMPALLDRVTNDTDPFVRMGALDSLRHLDPDGEAFGQAFARAIKDEDLSTRRHAAAIWAPSPRPPRSTSRGSRPSASPKSAIPSLLEALKDPDPQMRDIALGALQRSNAEAKAVVPALSALLKDEDRQVRVHAAGYLSQLGPESKAALPAMIAALKDDNAEVRLFIAQALGAIGPEAKEAIPALSELFQENNQQLRQAVTRALNQISNSGGFPR
jgi:beta-lactamase regulating signal transducer with metallopeptidase domain/HEAT repeat protein